MNFWKNDGFVTRHLHILDKKIKKAAKYGNLTIQQCLMKMIYDPVCKKSDEYNIRLQKMKREWTKEKLK